MGLSRNVSLSEALAYQGGQPYWGYIMHRLGGSALFIFFTLYVLDLAGVKAVEPILGNWLFQIIVLVFGLFHVINGLRITIFDLWPRLIPNYRQGILIGWGLYAFLAAYIIFTVLRNQFGA